MVFTNESAYVVDKLDNPLVTGSSYRCVRGPVYIPNVRHRFCQRGPAGAVVARDSTRAHHDPYVRHPELVQAREGFSLLDLKRYVEAFGARMVKKRGISHKQARNRRQSDSLSSLFQRRKGHDSPLIRTISIYKGEGLGQLALNDLIQRAPIMVPINANGYNHFVVFRGVLANRVLIADPAWGNRTMTADKFQRMWIDYGEPIGHVGFVITRADGGKAPNRLQPTMREFVMLQ